MNVLDIATRLIRFDTSGPPTRERPMAEWLATCLEDAGMRVALQEIEPGRANLIAKTGEGEGPGLLLSGHMDTVPAGDLELWRSTGPWEPRVLDGRLYGLGACDMKGPDACIVDAVRSLRGRRYKKQLTVAFTCGEDTDGWHVARLLGEKLVTPDDARMGVIPEPSQMELVRCHKAGCGARVAILGKAAHSSKPELGNNAILRCPVFLQEINALQKSLYQTTHPLLGYSTVEPTYIHAGIETHIVPDRCEVVLNCRLIPEHLGNNTVRRWMDDALESCLELDPRFQGQVLETYERGALDVPAESEVVTTLEDLLGTTAIGVPYFTEAVDYTRAGIPTVICGPGSIDQAHAPDEFITLEQLERGAAFFRTLIERVCL